jgi:hypothetical protein
MDKYNKQLLVEGNDDMHVLMALCQKFDINKNFEIIDCKGINKLLNQIPIRFKQSEIETLALVIDADTEISKRWNSLQSIFSKLEINLPSEIPAEGLILKTNGITIGIWIMPNNSLNGMLEDFISFLIPKGDKLLSLASMNLETIEKEKLNKYTNAHKSKALIHSWLAWQESPGTPMGLAITKKFLTTKEEICEKLISWLTKTFQ